LIRCGSASQGNARPVGEAAIINTETEATILAERVLFIDGEAIVIDKPAGLPVDTPRRGGDSLVARASELRFGFRSSPVPMHRLDQDTSGCLLLARNANARRTFQQAFEAREVRKYYLAVIASRVMEAEGTIVLPLAKASSEDAGWRMIADPGGQEAVTNWRRIGVCDEMSLVEFTPVTGRTHQIRIHAREAFGRGIVGDRVYGVPGGPMLLHASRLVVPRGDKAAIDVTAPLPEYFGAWPGEA
jgi:tRNA pseudouridine32 synthase/23S rRNA pseudouridine746 synthase